VTLVAIPTRAARTAWTTFVGALRALLRSRRALVGLCLVTVVVLMALISFVWTPYPPGAINEFAANLSPRWSHLAGTDELGRDVFSRIMAGARTSIAIAALAVGGALAAGTFVGFLTGYVGGAIDVVASRINDMLLAIPALAIALGVVAILQPSTFSVTSQIVAVAIALAAAYTPTFTRVVRGSVVSVRHQPFVEASRGLASSTPSIMARDIFPNVLPIIAVQVTTTLAWAIIDEAALGFLGLGVQPPTPSWGSLLNEGRTYLYQVPWLPVAAGIAVVIAILGINLFGDGLRDLLDPRAKK
jgi:peptide/nickel transport system permease protein